jgi:hypothetical protein
MRFGFTSFNNNNTSPWADYLHLRSYGDGSGGSDNLVMFLKSGIGMRIWQQSWNSGTAYSSYADVYTTSTFSYSTGVNASHVVQRDANGYIYANHINFNTSESENPTINSFFVSNGDGWSRKASLAHVRSQLGNYGGWITGLSFDGLSGKTGGSGTYQTSGDFRAPIFYDSNDTGYYADFNTTSNTGIRLRGGILMGPNPTWGAYLQVGGNGNETDYATVVATDGNLHMDSQVNKAMYLNYYHNGAIYLNGSTYSISSNGSYYNGTAAAANSVAWSNVSSRPTALSSFSNDVGYITGVTNISGYAGSVSIPDWRDTSYGPNTYSGNRVGWHFNNTGQNGGPAGDYWGAMQTVAPWSEFNTSHRQMQLWWGGSSGLSYRYAIGSGYTPSGWSGWERIITSENRSSFIDTLYYSGSSRLYTGSDGTRNTGWAYHNDNGTGLHWPNNGWHFYPKDASDIYVRSGDSGASALVMNTAGTNRGYVYANSSNHIGFLNNSRSWIFRVHSDGKTDLGGDTTASIYVPRHLEARDTWGNCGCTSLFLGWSTSKIILGNNSYGGHDYANNLGSNLVVSTVPFFSYQDITAYSDGRVKENVEVIQNALAKVQAIRGVTYTRSDNVDKVKRHAGVIAQEVLAVLPEVVSGSEDSVYSVAYGNMAGLFIEAIKELNAKISYLESQLASK